jgi:hypothetical protein
MVVLGPAMGLILLRNLYAHFTVRSTSIDCGISMKYQGKRTKLGAEACLLVLQCISPLPKARGRTSFFSDSRLRMSYLLWFWKHALANNLL